MIEETNAIFSMRQANHNFSAIARTAEKMGEAYIYKNNKPKFLVVDVEKRDDILYLTEDEKIEIVAKRVLNKYLDAFKELAKY